MKFSSELLNRKYYISNNVIYKIENTNGGGAVTNKDGEHISGYIPTILVIETNQKKTESKETVYYLDNMIEIGDILSEDTIVKVDTNKTLREYVFEKARNELQSYVSSHPTITIDEFFKKNPTAIPNWLFKDFNPSDYTYNIYDGTEEIEGNNLDEQRLNLQSVIQKVKKDCIGEELAKFIEQLEKKYGIKFEETNE